MNGGMTTVLDCDGGWLRSPENGERLAERRWAAPRAPGGHGVLVSAESEAPRTSGAPADLNGPQSLIDEAGSRIRDRREN